MLKSFLSVLFCFIFIASSGSYAQGMRFSLHGGLSLPQGDFASTSVTGDKSGFAKTGFCAMAEASQIVSGNMNWVSSVALSLNSYNETEKQNQINQSYLYPYYKVSSGNCVTTWAMTGIGFEGMIFPEVKLYGISQLGLLISSVPDIDYSYSYYSSTYPYSNYIEKHAITTSWGIAFAYAFGGGIVVNGLNVGIRYYTGEPEYEINNDGIKSKEVKPANVLQLTVGFYL